MGENLAPVVDLKAREALHQARALYIFRTSIFPEAPTHARFAAALAPPADLQMADHDGAVDRPSRDGRRACRRHAAPGVVAGGAGAGTGRVCDGAGLRGVVARAAPAPGLELLAFLPPRQRHPASLLGRGLGLRDQD